MPQMMRKRISENKTPRDDADADAANDPSSDRDVGGDETEI
jgi:hypothetical protein